MMEIVTLVQAVELFDRIADSLEHEDILEELVGGSWELLFQFRAVIDDQRYDADKELSVVVAEALYVQAQVRLGSVGLAQFEAWLDQTDDSSYIDDALRRGPKPALPANPQAAYDAYSVDAADAELTEHLIEHLSRGTVINPDGYF